MGIKISIERGLADRRRMALMLLPDICYFYPFVREGDGVGGWTEVLGEPLTYNGSSAIPCRLDPTKLYRQGDVFEQEIIINEYIINVPYDFDIPPDHRLVLNNASFEIRRIMDKQSGNLFSRANVVIIE